MNKFSNSVIIFFVFVISLAVLSACDNGSNSLERPKSKTQETLFSFVESSSGLPIEGQWRQGIAFYDMNRDGHLDILAPPPRKASKAEQRLHIWFGNGKGEWSFSPPKVPTIGHIYDYGDIAAGDFNGDGIPDMALAIHVNGLKALAGQGNGTYSLFLKGLPAREDFLSRALVSGDFNNDGIFDFATVSEGHFGKKSIGADKGAMVCLGSQNGWLCRHIGDEKQTQGLFADKIITGDINGDGNLDVGIASLQHRLDLIVWRGDGKGGFTPFNRGLPTQLHYQAIGFKDFNEDGRDDLIATITGFGPDGMRALKVFISEKEGFKDISSGLPDNEVYLAVAAGDFDGDGLPEIVAGTAVGGLNVFVQGSNKWRQIRVPTLPLSGLYRISNIYSVDLNSDGLDDIAVNYANEKNNGGAIRVFLAVPPSK